MAPPISSKGDTMKCEIFEDRDPGVLQSFVNGFIADKKVIEIKQSICPGVFLYPLLIITIFYEEVAK